MIRPIPRTTWVAVMILMAAELSAGCGDHPPAFLTAPPKMPPGYGILHTLPEGGTLMRKKDPNAILWDQVVVSNNILRAGVDKGVIFGLREDLATKRQSAFYVDTNASAVTLDIPPVELNDRLKANFGITDFATVPTRFYEGNSGGGPR